MREIFSRLSGDDRKGLMVAALGVVILAALAVTVVRVINAPENDYDRKTLCNTSLPRPLHHVFIIDVSDALSDYQKHFLRTHISGVLEQAAVNDRFTLFVLDEKYHGLSESVVDICKPETADAVSALTANRAFVERLYLERFEQPLDRAIAEVVAAGDQEVSPIYEALSDVVALDRLDGRAQEVHLTIVSDMIQNSRAGSVFSSGSAAIDNLPLINLRRARTTVLWLDREKYRQYQTTELQRSWQDYLASVSRFEQIERVRN
ncbi:MULTISPECIES: hypothetical protein [Microbulbifer]|uniref:hypothetical protein n=1 Tax=Microbulbifer TaxID=48073 RepID=UPI001E610C76|nr:MULTISPECIES: hypothetical protein [Microbulbifer]UHQ56420.1 hypothetical protein LVE68_05420 [Microbulbifer sp. YPW16]